MAPLVLPDGLVPIPARTDNPLAGARITDYRFDLLDGEENLVGALDSVVPGGSVSWDASAAIKGGGTITVTDLGEDIDWLNVRIRPWVIFSSAGVDEPDREVPVGVFVPTAPVEAWTATGRGWSVELHDKCSILDQDVVTDPSTGQAVTYTAPIGTNVVTAVTQLINDAGEATPAIAPGTAVLAAPLVWDMGTTRLKIINDMLDAANYFSLWADGQGQYQVTPFVPAAQRTPVYEALAPFSKGLASLMDPAWSRDRDIFAVPNRYVVVGQGDGDAAALTATGTNTDPASPFSYPNRGRWITSVETGVEAVDLPALQAYADRALANATSVTSAITASHIFLPDLKVRTVVRFTNPDAPLDILAEVTATTIPFDPVALCQSTLQEVLT